ncbi:MAG: hypothetical protein A2275_09505 [Bacteroidetes bacterium RIFOXYA12_FULL_35_11]|nr:MAG: hypothetical protein A2X01_06190 [Bacteroidetes bacterium GWF2_35_48]OFY78655.1 MAG: hypothetical protein A2275_09505 [Bacteroidetes bacterium RIFOXYA12_FULL_35_11]OFY95259.1 MAG: hypothetical protein A2309_03025 [Bacteroidetes bacterium RIFOXYB2_FULL_35_7]OFZ04836.1 MAG: hypothetical protein A2491_05605 [Bacteroidetes bacterium RIFOXYC12_FULL_35_7]HBX52737.1 hypothetical protein [Bacteroidales bacterium]
MTENNEHLKNLSEIRSIMERSSRFISLSGLSGIFAGLIALLGAAAVYFYFNEYYNPRYYNMGVFTKSELMRDRELYLFILFLLCDGIIVLALSLAAAVFFTTRNARKKGLKVWDNTAKRTLINLFIPLVAGGFFCMALLFHGKIYLIAPTTLVFYGLALINASKYTLNDIRYLGISELILGVIASFFVGYGLIAWAIGFGLLHIVYGIIMYTKYER